MLHIEFFVLELSCMRGFASLDSMIGGEISAPFLSRILMSNLGAIRLTHESCSTPSWQRDTWMAGGTLGKRVSKTGKVIHEYFHRFSQSYRGRLPIIHLLELPGIDSQKACDDKQNFRYGHVKVSFLDLLGFQLGSGSNPEKASQGENCSIRFLLVSEHVDHDWYTVYRAHPRAVSDRMTLDSSLQRNKKESLLQIRESHCPERSEVGEE
ncbi:hypothetical protein Tco_1217433 [Tanacetum coccineum]